MSITRRRYDTTALIDQMKTERRRGLVIGGAAAIVFIALVATYFIVFKDDRMPEAPKVRPPEQASAAPKAPDAPQAPGAAATAGPSAPLAPTPGAAATPANPAAPGAPSADAPGAAAAAAPTATPATSGTATPSAATAPTPSASKGSLTIALPRPLPVWIDESSLGPVKNHVAELEPGKHRVRFKLGKRVVQQVVVVEAGARYELAFDPKKKAPAIRKL